MALPKTARIPARDRIMAAASELFYREGIHSVGIDRIIAESGVAKMSLYNHFKSKDALIAAWLEEQEDSWCSWFRAQLASKASDPRDRLLAVFDVLQDWFQQPNFRGCPFINSTVELAKPEHPGYQVAQVHQQTIANDIRDLVIQAEFDDADALASQFLILVEGATIVAMMHNNADSARQAKQAAAILLAASEKNDG